MVTEGFSPTRRAFCLGSAVLAASYGSGALARTSRPFFGAGGPEIGLQLYPLLEPLQKDLAGTFRQIAAIGYRQVEALTFMGRTGGELRAALDRAQLTCRSLMALGTPMPGSNEPTLGGDLPRLADNAKAVGVDYIVLPAFPPPSSAGAPANGEDYTSFFRRAARLMRADDWKALADWLNERGAALARSGLKLAYHNHNAEFMPIDKTTGFAILMERTDPAVVAFEIDAGWVAAAGLDPVEVLEQYSGRFRLMHVKDLKKAPVNYVMQMQAVPVGMGIIDWKRVLPAAKAAGVIHYFVEQEPPYTEPPIDAVRKSRNFLIKLRAD